jgi:hypothetical protein
MDTIPDEVNVPFMLAQVYTRLGDNAQAAKAMAIAQDVEPKMATMIRMAQLRVNGKPILDGTAPQAPNNAEHSMDMG